MTWTELTRSYTVWDDNNIKGFFGENRWLSNFWPTNVWFEGELYPSSEHAYMAAKTLDLTTRKLFAKNIAELSCRDARKLGQTIELRPNWENIKADMMLAVVFDKFWRNKELRALLKATGDRYLEETNHWSDVFYGVDYKTGQGRNVLGWTLMRVRTCL